MAEAGSPDMSLSSSTPPPVDVDEPEHQPNIAFPVELLVDRNAAKDFICMDCHDLPREPFELACGHGVCCKLCRHRVNCEQEDDCKKPDNTIERMNARSRNFILSLNIKCLRSGVGCEWVGPVKEWDLHVIEQCDFARVPCMECAVDGVPQVHIRKNAIGAHGVECKRFECALKKNEINCPAGGRMNEHEFNHHREAAYLAHIDALGESLRKTKLNAEDRINMLQEQNRILQEEVDKLKQEAQDREEKVKGLSSEMDIVFQKLNEMNVNLKNCDARVVGCEYVLELRPTLETEEEPGTA